MIGRPETHPLDSKAHIDYSTDPNVVEKRMQHRNIGRDRYMTDMIHGMFCTSAWADRRIVNQDIPCKGHHPA